MRIKVYNGTASNSGDSLCNTCRHSTIIRGRRLDEEVVHCEAIGMNATRVTFKVTSCSSYSDVRTRTYMELIEDAWIFQPGSKKQQAGFVRGRDLRHDELRTILADLHTRSDE